jgi:acyl-CoA hydrolase
MTAKHPSDSKTVVTDMVLPGETNAINTLFGGELLARMDRAASITSQRHSEKVVVTASVNHVAFNHAIPRGSIVTIEAKVSRAFKTSMEVYLDVWYTDNNFNKPIKANEAIFTFVAVDENRRPVEIPELIPESEQEIKRYQGCAEKASIKFGFGRKAQSRGGHRTQSTF